MRTGAIAQMELHKASMTAPSHEHQRALLYCLRAGPFRKEWASCRHTPGALVGGIPLGRVWQDVDEAQNAKDGCSVAGLAGLPQYSDCFQGF